jgi:hypothetical protein
MPVRRKNYSELAKLVSAIGEKDWGVMGIGTFPTPNRPNCYDAVIKIPGVTLEEVRALVEAIPDQDIVDIREVG